MIVSILFIAFQLFNEKHGSTVLNRTYELEISNRTNDLNISNGTNELEISNETKKSELSNGTNESEISNRTHELEILKELENSNGTHKIQILNRTYESEISNGTNELEISNRTNESGISSETNEPEISNGVNESKILIGTNISKISNRAKESEIVRGTNEPDISIGITKSEISNGTNKSEINNETYEKVLVDERCNHSGIQLFCKHIIPKDLPKNVTHIYLRFTRTEYFYTIKSGAFAGKNWEEIKFLRIINTGGLTSYTMRNQTKLEELDIIGLSYFYLFPGSFIGLDHLRVLRLTNLTRLDIKRLTLALSFSLPRLEMLFLHGVHIYDYDDFTKFEVKPSICMSGWRNHYWSFYFFINVLAEKSLAVFEISQTSVDQILFILIQQLLQNYGKVSVSFSKFYNSGYFYDKYSIKYHMFYPVAFVSQCLINVISPGEIRNISLNPSPVFDASYITFEAVDEYVNHLHSLHSTTHTFIADLFPALSLAKTVNLTGIYQHLSNIIQLQNITVNIVSYFGESSSVKQLVMRDNRLSHLDVKFPCNESNLEQLDISANLIEFLQPEICLCCWRLREFNLSHNHLFKMAEMDSSLFEQVFFSYPQLEIILLSWNKFSQIPKDLFKYNVYLEQIDLSNNELTNVNFSLKHLENLQTLNLKSNRITILDSGSIEILQSFVQTNKHQHRNLAGILAISDNGLLCSECDTLSSVKWIASTPLIGHYGNTTMCTNLEGNHVLADQNAVWQVQELCDEPKRIRQIITISSTTPLATIVIVSISIYLGIRYRKKRLKRKNIVQKIKLIQRNELDTRFVVFLSYSSDDTDFMIEYVYNPLNIHLQEKIQTDREIICLGDRHFQLGKPINDEMVLTLQQSAVVLLLLSRNFCRSEYCRMEFNHALHMQKPFILMVKGEIDINEMVPSLQELFKRNTRMLWERDGNVYIMKTSWDNVSSSILDLIP